MIEERQMTKEYDAFIREVKKQIALQMYSLKEIADSVGVSCQMVSRYLRKKNIMSADVAIRFAKVLKVHIL